MTTIKTICLLTGCEGTVAASDPAVVAEAGEAMKASTSRPAGIQTTAGALKPGQRAWIYDGESRSWWPCEVAALPDNAPTGAHVRGRNGGPFRGQSCPLSTEAAMSNLNEFIEAVRTTRLTAETYATVVELLDAAIRAGESAHGIDESESRYLGALVANVRAARASAAERRDTWREWHQGTCEALLSECNRLDALAAVAVAAEVA